MFCNSKVNNRFTSKLMKDLLKTYFSCLLTASSFIFCPSVLAKTEVTIISKILAEPKDNMEVTIRGKIIDQEEGESDYIFTDGKDKIIVEIEQENFQYNPNENIEIYGVVSLESTKQEEEYDPTPEVIEIEVKEIKVVKE